MNNFQLISSADKVICDVRRAQNITELSILSLLDEGEMKVQLIEACTQSNRVFCDMISFIQDYASETFLEFEGEEIKPLSVVFDDLILEMEKDFSDGRLSEYWEETNCRHSDILYSSARSYLDALKAYRPVLLRDAIAYKFAVEGL